MHLELYQGPGHSAQAAEIHRRSSGRLRFVIVREADGTWWLHVQPAPSLASMSRRFRESHALRSLGFSPVAATRFFPSACTFGGCYSREIRTPDGGDVTDDMAAEIVAKLEPAVDALMQTAFDLEGTGIEIDAS